MSKHVLMVMTSHELMGDTGKKTGMWLEEFAAPYYAFKDAGYTLTLASPMGGQVPIDPNSLADDAIRYTKDEVARSAVASTIPLEDVRADEFDAAFCHSTGTSKRFRISPLHADEALLCSIHQPVQ